MAGPERDIRSRGWRGRGEQALRDQAGRTLGPTGHSEPDGAAGAGLSAPPRAPPGQWDQRQRPVVERVGALALALPFNSGLLGASVVVLPSLARDCASRAFLPWAASVS